MNQWKKLSAETAVEKYLVPSHIVENPRNNFYGRQTNVSFPVDTVGQFLAFLFDNTKQTIQFHFSTNESEHHEWLDDYNPLTTAYHGQYLYTDLETAQEMVAIIQEQCNLLHNTIDDEPMFKKVAEGELPFATNTFQRDTDNKAFYLQVRHPKTEKSNLTNYLILSGKSMLFMKILQVRSNSDDLVKPNYDEISRNSVSTLLLDRAGTAHLCQVMQEFISSV